MMIAAIALLAGALGAAAVQSNVEVVRFVALRNDGPVAINAIATTAKNPDPYFDVGRVQSACVSFTNKAPATAVSVGIQFIYYDGDGNRFDAELLERKGTFSTGVRQAGFVRNTPNVRRENCVTLKRPRNNFSAIVAYVDHVQFADGTHWNADEIRLADHVTPGSNNISYDFTDPAATPPVAQLAPNELAPLLIGTTPACTVSKVARVPSAFDPAVVAVVGPARNVFVAAEPGAPAVGSLFKVGSATVCLPSGNAQHDAAALATVEGAHVAIRQEEVFRVYIPAISSSPACNDDVRLLTRVLIDASPLTESGPTAKPGDYTAIVHISVSSSGHAAGASVVQSAGPPEFDDATRRSALASRYWPAIARGKPVLSGYDFAMRWIVKPGPVPGNLYVNQRTLTNVYGPPFQPAAAACEV
jgi:hypothetical protein